MEKVSFPFNLVLLFHKDKAFKIPLLALRLQMPNPFFLPGSLASASNRTAKTFLEPTASDIFSENKWKEAQLHFG